MRVYTFRRQFTNPTAVTLLQLHAGAANPLVILRAWLNQQSSTTSTAGGVHLGFKSTGATVTQAASSDIYQHDQGDAAESLQFGTTGTGYNASGEGTDGDIPILEGFNWVGTGWLYLPVPEERIVVEGGAKFALKNLVAFTGTVNAGITFGELG